MEPFTSGPPLLEAVKRSHRRRRRRQHPAALRHDQDKSLKAVSAYSQGATGDAIVVPRGSTISDVEDLKGKKVAVAKGSSANYNLLAQLDAAGLTFDDITPVYLQPTDALAAFNGGSVDAWSIWDPFTAQAEVDTGARVLSDGKGLVNGLVFQVAGDDALEDTATRRGARGLPGSPRGRAGWAAKHKDEWATAWSQETGLPPTSPSARSPDAPNPDPHRRRGDGLRAGDVGRLQEAGAGHRRPDAAQAIRHRVQRGHRDRDRQGSEGGSHEPAVPLVPAHHR